MTERDPTNGLSAAHQFVLVLRLVVEDTGKVTGELVDPLSERRQRFIGLASLAEAIDVWIADVLSTVRESGSQPGSKPADEQSPS